jgi:hypothetical protein
MRRLILRIMPIVTIIYLIAIIERANIGFAKLQMVQDLHMSEAAYGLGASLFFIGYLLFEIPSTLAVHRFGARVSLAQANAPSPCKGEGWGGGQKLVRYSNLRPPPDRLRCASRSTSPFQGEV